MNWALHNSPSVTVKQAGPKCRTESYDEREVYLHVDTRSDIYIYTVKRVRGAPGKSRRRETHPTLLFTRSVIHSSEAHNSLWSTLTHSFSTGSEGKQEGVQEGLYTDSKHTLGNQGNTFRENRNHKESRDYTNWSKTIQRRTSPRRRLK